MTADQIAEKPTLVKWPTQSGAFYTLLMFGKYEYSVTRRRLLLKIVDDEGTLNFLPDFISFQFSHTSVCKGKTNA